MLSTLNMLAIIKQQKNIQNQYQRNNLEVVKILHTGETNRKSSVLCYFINPFLNITFHLLESNIHFIVIRNLIFLSVKV